MSSSDSDNYDQVYYLTRTSYIEAGCPNHLTASLFCLISDLVKNISNEKLNILKSPPKILENFNESKKEIYFMAFQLIMKFLEENKMDLVISAIDNELCQKFQFPKDFNSTFGQDTTLSASNFLQNLIDSKERFVSESDENNEAFMTSFKENFNLSSKSFYSSMKSLNPLLCSGNSLRPSTFSMSGNSQEEEDVETYFGESNSDLLEEDD
ncbi:hypothetical protein TRFO_14172 [Tritrichomonas foetus]|uniref:LisH domain-containing protein n=1 Tax=Tritrichomonas foetus TaxID=1144522 RepID=A0A1J4L0E3_9EUKA|nr:hypothetical protein TRFO_14172 [Tritrichomonas foetus]|eukprot:OHT15404.1 hypothetical protein TRFO_14172 [Tritrichomonas foetus]